MKKNFLFATLTFLVLFFVIEFCSFFASYNKLLIFNNEPYIYNKNKDKNINRYWNEKEVWGAWHEKNITVKHKKTCFDVEYNTNEIGARDD